MSPAVATQRETSPRLRGAETPHLKHVTRRERDVIQGVMDGLSNKEISARLGLSMFTAKTYTCRIMEKVGVGNRLALAQWGRAFIESQRRVAARFRELHPDSPEIKPTFSEVEVLEFDVLRALAQSAKLTSAQAKDVAMILLEKAMVQ